MFKTLALAVFLLVASPSQFPELAPRDVNIDCDGKFCKVSQEDMEYIIKRDQTLSALATKLAVLVKACGVKDI